MLAIVILSVCAGLALSRVVPLVCHSVLEGLTKWGLFRKQSAKGLERLVKSVAKIIQQLRKDIRRISEDLQAIRKLLEAQKSQKSKKRRRGNKTQKKELIKAPDVKKGSSVPKIIPKAPKVVKSPVVASISIQSRNRCEKPKKLSIFKSAEISVNSRSVGNCQILPRRSETGDSKLRDGSIINLTRPPRLDEIVIFPEPNIPVGSKSCPYIFKGTDGEDFDILEGLTGEPRSASYSDLEKLIVLRAPSAIMIKNWKARYDALEEKQDSRSFEEWLKGLFPD
jgi:hypothetical protein